MPQIRPNGSFILPNGHRYRYSQRQQIITMLNDLITGNNVVHEVVAVVEPGLRKLRGMTLEVCNVRDNHSDPDWAAEIKVTRLCCSTFNLNLIPDALFVLGVRIRYSSHPSVSLFSDGTGEWRQEVASPDSAVQSPEATSTSATSARQWP